MPFRLIAAGMRQFSLNRGRIRAFVRRPAIATVLRYGMLLTLLAWLAIAFWYGGESDDRLADALKNLGSTPTEEAATGPAAPSE